MLSIRCILGLSMEQSQNGMDDSPAFAESTRRGFKLKADHNKQESLCFFVVVIACSLTSPLFITLGHGLWLGKVIPSVLSLVAAGGTAWLQLRKPQSLWSIYRDCQRRVEDSQTKYVYGLEEYAVSEDERRVLLANDVRKIAWDAHRRWLPLVPTPEAIGGYNSKGVIGDGN
ncbi:SLATT domain-containing protein [Aphanothece minutissima]|nr:SLATT domain-containing protein [Aphanothece minutissima]